MGMLGNGYYPVILFKSVDSQGKPGEVVFDNVLCMTKEEAIRYAKREIGELQELEDSKGIAFWAEAWGHNPDSRKRQINNRFAFI